ncbi:MAG: DUF1211 domain-containing protein [Candidatus Pacebacteria bacterium]|nr:DUF1211 domain-containing protein [Candidatus Paceibacterota bacterium]
MKQQRLEQLADGIFSIVMTLLVLEIHIPVLPLHGNNIELLFALKPLIPLFLSYLLSFTLLFSYWRSHHFIMSVFVHNVDHRLVNINGIFFFLIALVPFTSHFLGAYSTYYVSIWVFALQFILIGLCLLWMRSYAESSLTIANSPYTDTERRHAYMRTIFPILCAFVAIFIAFRNTEVALFLFTMGILFNLSKRSTHLMSRIVGIFVKSWKEESV